MELEKFQFQGTFDKIQFIAPLSKGKRIKIIEQIPIKMLNISSGGRRGSTKRMQLRDKKMMFNQAQCISSCDSVSAQNGSLAVRKMQIFHPKLLNESKVLSLQSG